MSLMNKIQQIKNDNKNKRGSAVAFCLVILLMMSAVIMIFLHQVRNSEKIAFMFTDVMKMQLLAESGLERAIGAMENQWRPATGGNPANFNFSNADLQDVANLINQEYDLTIFKDERGNSISTGTKAKINVKFIYHGGKLDPNWYGLNSNEKNPLPAIGFSPVAHSLGQVNHDGKTIDYDLVAIQRDSDLKPIVDNENLWFTREQALDKIHNNTLTEVDFLTGNVVSEDIFFPYSPRDALSPKQGTNEDLPYLVVRPLNEKCRCITDPTNATAYERQFHEKFCEKYGDGRCVYFGGSNTFLDQSVASYDEKGNLQNPELAIKRRIPFYCLRYLKGPVNDNNYNYVKKRLPSMISFWDDPAVPEYLRGMPLVDCLPWFKTIVNDERYGGNGQTQNLWRFWALLSNMARYCGPSSASNYTSAIAVYDSHINGLPYDGESYNFPYCGLRQCPQISKIRFNLVKNSKNKVRIVVDLELVNFFVQSQYWGNCYMPQWSQIELCCFFNGQKKSFLSSQGNGTDRWKNADGNVLDYGPKGGANGAATFELLKTYDNVRYFDTDISWQEVTDREWITVDISKFAIMIDFNFLSKKYGGWGDAFRIHKEFMSLIPQSTKLRVANKLATRPENNTLVLECIDPLANTGSDAWIIGNNANWGKPSPSWYQANGALAEGKITVNGADIPRSAFIRGTLGGTTSGSSGSSAVGALVSTDKEQLASHPFTLWELGCIHRALPGKTIDILGGDQALLEQFCLFPGDDAKGLALAKELYAKENPALAKYLTESGKINPNVMKVGDLKGIERILSGLKKKESDLLPTDIFIDPFDKLESFSSNSLERIENFVNHNFINRGDAALAITNQVLPASASISEKEEVVCKLAQLMQTRYQYFEVVVNVEICKEVDAIDRQNNAEDVSCRSKYLMTVVIERDAFTGKVRVVNQRVGHKVP